jgi:hypothetical protein
VHPSPATVAALLLVLAALALIALTAATVRPRPLDVRATDRPPAQQREHRLIAPRVVARRATPAPAAAPPRTTTATPPEAVVAAYYRALDARRFDGAWSTLAPAVQSAFGGFERWRAGYATTVASRPGELAVQRDGAVATVVHELAAEDRSPCGPVRRRFAVRWRLVLGPNGWRASSLSAVKRSGPEPDAACAS